jgi:hypothetical protein
MRYTDEEIEIKFDEIISLISDKGLSVRNILKQDDMPSSKTFYVWLDTDEVKVKQYAHACEKRADAIFEDILTIADDTTRDKKTTKDGEDITDNEVIQRSRLRVDARKWMVSKMNPKKYGDKIDMTTGGDKIKTSNVNLNIDGKDIKLE